MKRSILCFLVIAPTACLVNSQPLTYTGQAVSSYFYNPAFTGTARCTRILSAYQYLPHAQYHASMVSADAMIQKIYGGAGIVLNQQYSYKTGFSQTDLRVTYAYQLQITRGLSLRAGVYNELSFHKNRFIQTSHLYDFAPISLGTENINRQFHYDVGAGILLFSEGLMLGFSAQHFARPVFYSSLQPYRLPVSLEGQFFMATGKPPKNGKFSNRGLRMGIRMYARRYMGNYNELAGPRWIFNTSYEFSSRGIALAPLITAYGSAWLPGVKISVNANARSILYYQYTASVSESKPENNIKPQVHEAGLGYTFNCKPKRRSFRTISCPSFGGGGYYSAPSFGSISLKNNSRSRTEAEIEIQQGIVSDTSFNTEDYNKITDNPFRKPVDDALSTFSIDVDNASYSNVRRKIEQGGEIEKDAVRIEEFLNYFKYGYKQPSDGKPFSVTTTYTACPWAAGHTLLKIGLQGENISTEKLPSSNLVFLIDVSGSMDTPNKLPLVKKSLLNMLDYLDANDHISIVVYANAEGLVLPPTSCNEKEKIKQAIENLEAGGSTAGGAGILLAYKVAAENYDPNGINRIIMATDGDFNIGVSSDGELIRMVEEKRKTGVYLTMLGFGEDNLKDSRMESIADNANGNYFYIDTKEEGKRVLGSNLAGTLLAIAKDVKIQVEFNPREVWAYRLIGYENRILNKEDFNNDVKDAGEIGAGHTVTAIYEIIPAKKDEGAIDSLPAIDDYKYQHNRLTVAAFTSNEIATLKLRYKLPEDTVSQLLKYEIKNEIEKKPNADDQFALAVAGFGLLLRESPYKGTTDYALIKRLAESGIAGKTERKEFIKLVNKAENLVDKRKKEEAERKKKEMEKK